MSLHIDTKSFLRKNSSYFNNVPLESILKSFWYYCNGNHNVSDLILKISLEQAEKNKKEIEDLDKK